MLLLSIIKNYPLGTNKSPVHERINLTEYQLKKRIQHYNVIIFPHSRY